MPPFIILKIQEYIHTLTHIHRKLRYPNRMLMSELWPETRNKYKNCSLDITLTATSLCPLTEKMLTWHMLPTVVARASSGEGGEVCYLRLPYSLLVAIIVMSNCSFYIYYIETESQSFRYTLPCLWNQVPFLFVNRILVPVLPFPTHLFLHPSLLPLLIYHSIHLGL